MSAYTNITFEIPAQAIQPVVQAMNSTTTAIKAGIDAAVSVIDLLGPIVTVLDAPTIDAGSVIRAAISGAIGDIYNGEIQSFHLYPESQWRELSFRGWKEAVRATLSAAEIEPGSKAIIWLIANDTADEIKSSSNSLLALFGRPAIEEEIQSVTRDPAADYSVEPTAERPIDLFPGLKSLVDAMGQASDSFGNAGGFGDMFTDLADVLRAKSSALSSLIQRLTAALEQISQIPSLDIRRAVVASSPDTESLIEEIIACTGGPGETEFAAGSIFVYSAAMAPVVEAML